MLGSERWGSGEGAATPSASERRTPSGFASVILARLTQGRPHTHCHQHMPAYGRLASSADDLMYGPAVRCKGKRELECTVLHQCIRPRVGGKDNRLSI
jgi:hypothetical protein